MAEAQGDMKSLEPINRNKIFAEQEKIYAEQRVLKEKARMLDRRLSKLERDVDSVRSGGIWPKSYFSYDYCFLAEVTASNLKEDKLYLPEEATSCTALNKQFEEMIVVNKEGNSWIVSLRFCETDGMFYISRGWRKFCLHNRCEIGDLFGFNVVGDGVTTPLMCEIPPWKEREEILSNYMSSQGASGSRVR